MIGLGGGGPGCGWSETIWLTPAEDGSGIEVEFTGYPNSEGGSPIDIDDCDEDSDQGSVNMGTFSPAVGFVGFIRHILGSIFYWHVQGCGCEKLDEEQLEFLSAAVSFREKKLPGSGYAGSFLAHFSDTQRRKIFWRGPGSYRSDEFYKLVTNMSDVLELGQFTPDLDEFVSAYMQRVLEYAFNSDQYSLDAFLDECHDLTEENNELLSLAIKLDSDQIDNLCSMDPETRAATFWSGSGSYSKLSSEEIENAAGEDEFLIDDAVSHLLYEENMKDKILPSTLKGWSLVGQIISSLRTSK
jgi:hypothetical protein